jgi:hypothetical protein
MSTYTCAVIAAGSQGRVHAQGYLAAQALGSRRSRTRTRTPREPALRSEFGVHGAEVIFATYESSRSRRRVPMPLNPVDNALLSGLAQGFWRPTGEQRSTY